MAIFQLTDVQLIPVTTKWIRKQFMSVLHYMNFYLVMLYAELKEWLWINLIIINKQLHVFLKVSFLAL